MITAISSKSSRILVSTFCEKKEQDVELTHQMMWMHVCQRYFKAAVLNLKELKSRATMISERWGHEKTAARELPIQARVEV